MSPMSDTISRIRQRTMRPGAASERMRLDAALEVADDEDDDLLRACENFLGAHGGNPDQQEAYRARAMEDLIADPDVPKARKDQLRAALMELKPKPLPASETERGDTPPRL